MYKRQGATRAAQQRAGEIETAFSHTRPDGSNFTTALTAAGVTYRAAGENIAYGQKSAGQVMQDWMNSAGHRANIMNGNFTSIGIGHYKSCLLYTSDSCAEFRISRFIPFPMSAGTRSAALQSGSISGAPGFF